MLLIFGTFCLALAAARFCPDTRLGKLLLHALIKAPAEGLNREGLRKLGVTGLVVIALMVLAAAPELLAIVAVSDLAILVEVAGIVVLAGATEHIKRVSSATVRGVQTVFRPLVQWRRRDAGRAHGQPARRDRARKPPAEPHPDWAVA